MGTTSRRIFLLQIAATGTAFAATPVTPAPGAMPTVDEKDPQAAALGYVSDTTKADAKKFPKHANDQKCATCVLFQGKAGDKDGPCPIFAGRKVMAAGWCSSWAKKPA